MAQPNQAQLNFKSYADNLKKTALGVKFSKQLFTDPMSLSPKTILTVMRALGVQVPEGVVITAEVAQVIVSGQAVASGLEAGKSLSEMNSQTNMTTAGVRALTSIAEQQSWIDADAASVIRIGTSVALIAASAGTNIAAWVSLALDLASATQAKQGLADYRAIISAQDQYRARITPQSKILGDTFKDYQEKRISIYGVIAKMAVETPDLWPQVMTPDSPITQAFPSLMMLPTVGVGVTGSGTAEISGSWPWPAKGGYVIARWESSKTINFSTLGKQFNKEVAAEYFFETLLKPWIVCYALANNEIVGRGNMSMQNIAALSYMVNPNGEISDKDDYVKFLIGSCLTPYDFGDNILHDIAEQYVIEAYAGQDLSFHESAVSYGTSAANKSFSANQKDREIMRRKLEQVKASDDIVELVQYEYIYKKLKSYMDFETVSFEKDPTLGGRLAAQFNSTDTRAWRKLHNYVAVIQMLDAFRTDSYLSNTRFAAQLLPFMPSVDAFTSQVEHINFLSTTRSVNRLALSNIAGFLDAAPKELVKVNKGDNGAAIYTIK